MSFGVRPGLPAFGISRSQANEKTSATGTNIVNEPSIKIPIVDLKNYVSGQVGDIILNASDSMVYYHTGHHWIPLAIVDAATQKSAEISSIMTLENSKNVIIEAPGNGNIHLIAGTTIPGTGGHVYVSAGQGGLDDGEIYMQVGGERALIIQQTTDVIVSTGDLQISSGDLIVSKGNLELHDPVATISCNIARATIKQQSESTTLVSLTDDEDTVLPNATLNGMAGVLTVKASIVQGESVKGTIRNSLVQGNSVITLTPVCDGCPNVWISNIGNGHFQYNIYCLHGSIKKVCLHFQILNDL